jgi:hypothetical protein
MKSTVKLLLACAVLVVASLSAQPARALPPWGICQAQPYDGIYSDAECAQYCYSGGCTSYEHIGSACYCS